MIRVAVLILTIEGLQHAEGGVARYVWNVIDAAPAARRAWGSRGIELRFYAAETICGPDAETFQPGLLDRVDRDLAQVGGRVIRLASHSRGDNSFRDPLSADPNTYAVASAAAAQTALELGRTHDAVMVVGGNTLFAQAPPLLAELAPLVGVHLRSVHLTHSAVPAEAADPREPRVEINDDLARAARRHPWIQIGYESEFMRRSYQARYGLPDSSYVAFHSGIPIDHPHYRPMTDDQVRRILADNGIPVDRPLALSWGRSDPSKGFDVLLRACGLVGGDITPVILNPTRNRELDELRRTLSSPAVLMRDKPFEVIAAVLQWPLTRVVAFCSLQEPASVTPAEAMLAAHARGCVVVAVPTGCYPDTVEHGRTGLVATARTPAAVAESIREVLAMPPARTRELGEAAMAYVVEHRSFATNFNRFLTTLLTDGWLDQLAATQPKPGIRKAAANA